MNIAIYTNILTPYRKFFYDQLYKVCKKNGDDFHVIIMAATEPNRNWNYEDLKTDYTILLPSKTITVSDAYIHFNSKLKETLAKFDLDYLICAGSYLCPGVWKALKLKNKLGYKAYYWSESHLKEEKKNGRLKKLVREWLRKKVYQKIDGFWFAGQLSRQFINAYALADADYIFMPNVVDEKIFSKGYSKDPKRTEEVKKSYLIDNDRKILLTPARLTHVKGLIEFIDILKSAKEKKAITWVIAGDGELAEEIQKKATEEKIDIRLVGYKNEEEMVQLYQAADFFVLPSLSDPNPLTVIEALWAGLPLLVSEHVGNNPEAVKGGENGYVFSYGNIPQAIGYVDALVKSDSEWIEAASRKSRSIAESLYNSELTAERVMEYFRNKISDSK